MVAGLLSIPIAAVVVAAYAWFAVMIGDKGSVVIAAVGAVGAGIATALASIAYMAPFVHGLLCAAAAGVTFEIVAIVTLGLRAAAARRLGRSSFLDDWFKQSSFDRQGADSAS